MSESRLPILLSVPHAGLGVPERLREAFLLTPEQVVADGDEQAAEAYALDDVVARVVRTGVARAVIDMNRAEDDVREDGIFKTVSCWDEPVWKRPLSEVEQRWLIETYHRPYHEELTRLARTNVRFGVDGHTMAAIGPPVARDHGAERPAVCIGTGNGAFPPSWARSLLRRFQELTRERVTVDDPFGGGHITRLQGAHLPWVQIELSRGPWATVESKRALVSDALGAFCRDLRQGLVDDAPGRSRRS